MAVRTAHLVRVAFTVARDIPASALLTLLLLLVLVLALLTLLVLLTLALLALILLTLILLTLILIVVLRHEVSLPIFDCDV